MQTTLLLIWLLQLPQPSRTPGAVNSQITQQNIKETICSKHWSTKSVRPSSEYTTKLKLQQMQAWGLGGKPKDYEEDHLISLELGGNPTDPNNLWPEAYKPKPGAREKDQVEDYLHRQVCSGAMTLKKAQELIAADWLTLYKSLTAEKNKRVKNN